ncbi:MAG: hypothetical protein A2X93_07430 [Deltaproteobacteria bacterium GWC2_56_8]|nr:MAG: hypothetical protein A2X99_02245 [Deltaproteobacteria bacterium GWB2_55_19]OGP35245.1 MAG: hypothetical protein A2X93_07430 [Deltaproteobacteria bacterium GWC2_56_8]
MQRQLFCTDNLLLGNKIHCSFAFLRRPFGVHALELMELLLHLLHATEVGDFHAAVLRLPVVVGGVRYAVLTVDVLYKYTGLRLLLEPEF